MQPLALIALRTEYMRICVMQAARLVLKSTSAGLTYLPIVSVCFLLRLPALLPSLMSWVRSGALLGLECKAEWKDCLHVSICLLGAGLWVGSLIACMVLSHTTARTHVDRSSESYSEQWKAGVLGLLQLWLSLMVFLMPSTIVGVLLLCTASSVSVLTKKTCLNA